MDRCLLCLARLEGDALTEEHIIPQAIGGIFTTRRAICRTCNSKGGSSTEAALTKRFETLSVFFDVIRDRGKEGPRIEVRDKATGTRYELDPGGNPVVAANPTLWRDETGKKYVTISGPNEDEVRRRIRLYTKQDPATATLGSKRSVDEVSLELSVFTHGFEDEQILRCVAKMAASFAREVGVPLGPRSFGAAFIRGDPVASTVVGPVARDVVTASHPPETVTHGIVLRKDAGRNPLVAYVWLFDVCEFSVLLHPWLNGPAVNVGHKVDLATGRAITGSYDWLTEPGELMLWTQPFAMTPRAFNERMNHRMGDGWLGAERMKSFWIRRASSRSTRVFADMLNAGVSEEEAVAAAQVEMEHWLRRSGTDRFMREIPRFPGFGVPPFG